PRELWLFLLPPPRFIFFLNPHRIFPSRFKPLLEALALGQFRFAVTAITIAEVLTGPLQAGDEPLARRYRATLERWQPVPIDTDIAETAARLRAALRLKLADAIQAASALAIH